MEAGGGIYMLCGQKGSLRYETFWLLHASALKQLVSQTLPHLTLGIQPVWGSKHNTSPPPGMPSRRSISVLSVD